MPSARRRRQIQAEPLGWLRRRRFPRRCWCHISAGCQVAGSHVDGGATSLVPTSLLDSWAAGTGWLPCRRWAAAPGAPARRNLANSLVPAPCRGAFTAAGSRNPQLSGGSPLPPGGQEQDQTEQEEQAGQNQLQRRVGTGKCECRRPSCARRGTRGSRGHCLRGRHRRQHEGSEPGSRVAGRTG